MAPHTIAERKFCPAGSVLSSPCEVHGVEMGAELRRSEPVCGWRNLNLGARSRVWISCRPYRRALLDQSGNSGPVLIWSLVDRLNSAALRLQA
jgi:hypothetical protein